MNGPSQMDGSRPVNPVKNKPPIPTRQFGSRSVFGMPAARKESESDEMDFDSEFLQQNAQVDEGDITNERVDLSESNMKELDDFEITVHDEDEDEETEEEQDEDGDKENEQPDFVGTNQKMPNMAAINPTPNSQPHFSLSFSSEKLGDDLLLDESANILIDNSGNKSRLDFNDDRSSKNVTLDSSTHNHTINNESSRAHNVNNMLQATLERIKRIGITAAGRESINFDSSINPETNARLDEHRGLSAASMRALPSKINFNLDASKREEQPSRIGNNHSFEMNSMLAEKQNDDSMMAVKEKCDDHDATLEISSVQNAGKTTPLAGKDADLQLTLSSSIYFKTAGGDGKEQDSFNSSARSSLPFVSFSNQPASAPDVSSQFQNSFGGGPGGQFSAEWEGNFANADDFLEELNRAEQINRKEFANNELTIVHDSTDGSSGASSGGGGPSEKWWNMDMNNPQSSKLEISTLTNTSNLNGTSSSEDMNQSLANKSTTNKKGPSSQTLALESPAKKKKSAEPEQLKQSILQTSHASMNGSSFQAKKAIGVDEYFTLKSALPVYLAEKDPGVNFSPAVHNATTKPDLPKPQASAEPADDANEMTICEENVNRKESVREAPVRVQKESESSSNDDDITFSTSHASLQNENFSFTFNTSETGDFILRKGENVPKKKASEAASSRTDARETNLDTIGKELASISNRLNSNSNGGLKAATSSSKLPVMELTKNGKDLADETLCSVPTFEKEPSNFKAHAEPTTDLSYAKSKTSQMKSKMPTSTPSKLTRSGNSSKNASKISMSDSSSLNIVSGAPQIHKHNKYQANNVADGSSDSNHFFSQESFISSIPERTGNDTTIANLNRHRPHKKSLKRQKNSAESKASATESSSYDPASSRSSLSNDSNESVEMSSKARLMNQNIMANSASTSALPNASAAGQSMPGAGMAPDMTSNALNNPFTQSMLSNTAASTMSNPNSLVPVAFLPMAALLPCFKRMYDEQQQQQQQNIFPNATGMSLPLSQMHQSQTSNPNNFSSSNMRLSNNDFDVYNRLNVDTNTGSHAGSQNCFSSGAGSAAQFQGQQQHNYLLSASSTINSLSPRHAYEAPQVAFNQTDVDFGFIAEGCCETKRLYMNLQNRVNANPETSYFLVEVDQLSEWSAEEYNDGQPAKAKPAEGGNSKSVRFKELKAKLGKAVSLSLTRETDSKRPESSSSSLKMPFASNFYEFFVHLDTKSVNYFQELLNIQKEQTGYVSEKLKPVAIKTELFVYFCASSMTSSTSSLMSLASEHSTGGRRHLVAKIDLRFVLGYAYLKSSGGLKEVVFQLPDHQAFDSNEDACHENSQQARSKLMSRLSYGVDDADKTLTSISDARRASDSSLNSIYIKKKVDERLVPLSNSGNIDMVLNCFFSYNQDDKDKSMSSMNVGSYELRLERSSFTLEPGASKPIRLVAHIKRMNQTQENYLPLAHFQRSHACLVLETIPNGFRFEIPIRINVIQSSVFKLPKEVPSASRAFAKPAENRLNKPETKSQKMSSLSSSSLNIRLMASKRVLFFAKSIKSRQDVKNGLNATNSCSFIDDESLPTNSFTISNSNSVPVQYEMSIVTLNNGADYSMIGNKKALSKYSSQNYFRFHESMLSSSISADDSLSKMTFQLEPAQTQRFSLEFLFNVASKKSSSNPICHGVLRVSVSEISKVFDISLVGFSRDATSLDIENATSVEARLFFDKYLSEAEFESSLIEQLGHQKILVVTHTTEMNRLTTGLVAESRNHRKLLVLKNRSSSSRCLVYPLLFSSNLAQPLKSESKLEHKAVTNEKWYSVESVGGVRSSLKILYKMNSIKKAASSDGELMWFELKPEEEYQLNFELISPKDASDTQFYLVLLWLDYDINAYCSINARPLKSSSASTPQNFLERFVDRILDQTNFDSFESAPLKPSSRSSSTSSLHSFDSSNQSMYSNLDTSQMSYQSSQANRDDYLRLLKSCIKCAMVRMALPRPGSSAPGDQSMSVGLQNNTLNRLPDYLFAANEGQPEQSHIEHDVSSRQDRMKRWTSLKNNQISHEYDDVKLNFSLEGVREEESQPAPSESWSLSTNSIVFDRLQEGRPLTSYAKKFTIRNNLKHKPINFEVLCKSVCVDFHPTKGVVRPLDRVEITVVPASSVFRLKTPSASLVVHGNKIPKTISISLPLAASTSFSEASRPTRESLAPEKSTAFETTVGDLTQYTIESLQITPLINASFSMPNASCLANGTMTEAHASFKRSDSDCSNALAHKSLSNASQLARSNSLQNTTDAATASIDDSVQIISAGQDAKIVFPVLSSMQTKTFELSFSNPWNQYVYWRAFAPKPAAYRAGEALSLDAASSSSAPASTLAQSVFSVTPSSGKMAPSQTEKVKIEFGPRDLQGSFAQVWEIETRMGLDNVSMSSEIKPGPSAFSCQLHLFGRSAPAVVQLEPSILEDEKKFFNRIDNRLFKSKTNQNETPQQQSQNSATKTDLFAKTRAALQSKENILQNMSHSADKPSSQFNATSTALKSPILYIKERELVFPDALPHQSVKLQVVIMNPEPAKFSLSVIKPHEPFYCKFADTDVSAGHYIKIPIEFRPHATGVYKDKIIFSVKNETRPPLFCNLIGKCVSSIQKTE